MKNVWFAALAALVLVGCEATFVDPPAPMEERNIVLRHFFYFKNKLIDTNLFDSLCKLFVASYAL